MVKFKINFKFNKSLLNKLVAHSSSGVTLQRIKHHLALHPVHLNDLNKSVKDILSLGIAKYNKDLDGLLLGYQNIKLAKDGIINNDSCYIHMDLEADFFVFNPEIDKEMQGIVNRQTKSHVGVLVYDAFNVSIPRPDDDEEWLGNSIQIGSEILFRITFIDLSSHLPYIRGELIKVVTHIDEDISLPSEKSRKFKGSNKTLLDESVTDGSSINKIPKKKKHNSASNEFDSNEDSISKTPVFKKSKKQKKELSFNSETEDEITVSFNKHTSELRQSKKKNKHKNEPETPAETPKKKKKITTQQDSKTENIINGSEDFDQSNHELSHSKKKLKHKNESEGPATPKKNKKETLHEGSEIGKRFSDSHFTPGTKNEIYDEEFSAVENRKKKRKLKSEPEFEESFDDLTPEELLPTKIKRSKSSLGYIEYENNSDNSTDSFKSHKYSKRKHSLSESGLPSKKHKKKEIKVEPEW